MPLANSLSKNYFKCVHFIGISGIGLSGIAKFLHNMGVKVQGSDLNSKYAQELKSLGVKIFEGHNQSNITDNISLVVKSTAITDDNPEVLEAINLGIKVISRADILAEVLRNKVSICISGTHGKTTTTSLVAHALQPLNPNILVGGLLHQYKTNAVITGSEIVVLEADESDGTFIKIPATVAIVTNMDEDHMDYYKSFEAVKTAYKQFISNIPFYGFAVICFDDPGLLELSASIQNRLVLSYGISNQNVDLFACDITQQGTHMYFTACFSQRMQKEYGSPKTERIGIPIIGEHNINNTLAAIIVACVFDVNQRHFSNLFLPFQGIKRRFNILYHNEEITLVDDYAHHPVEIKATLKAAKAFSSGKVFAVIQPHRYTRVAELLDEFACCVDDANCVILTNIYGAGEKPIEGISIQSLIDMMKINYPEKTIVHANLISDILDVIKTFKKPGDVVICMGAGDITDIARDLCNKIMGKL